MSSRAKQWGRPRKRGRWIDVSWEVSRGQVARHRVPRLAENVVGTVGRFHSHGGFVGCVSAAV